METYTMQTAFDKASAHLLKQNKLSIAEYGFCAYRGQCGTMCAIGVLIPDDIYTPLLEGMPIEAIMDCDITIANILPINENFLSDLQCIHDCFDPIDWRRQLIRLAKLYNLNHNL